MRAKTFLTPEQQWDRTAALAMKCGFADVGDYLGLNHSWYVGRIVQSHKFFRAGDFVVIEISNGFGERQTVWAVSSKGYTVKKLYLNYSKFSEKLTRGKKYCIGFWSKATGKMGVAWVRRKCRRTLTKGNFAQGPLRFVDVPENLTGCQPDFPPLRQHIVALAREGWRTPDKRE